MHKKPDLHQDMNPELREALLDYMAAVRKLNAICTEQNSASKRYSDRANYVSLFSGVIFHEQSDDDATYSLTASSNALVADRVRFVNKALEPAAYVAARCEKALMEDNPDFFNI